jgi:hypothetical protein
MNQTASIRLLPIKLNTLYQAARAVTDTDYAHLDSAHLNPIGHNIEALHT